MLFLRALCASWWILPDVPVPPVSGSLYKKYFTKRANTLHSSCHMGPSIMWWGHTRGAQRVKRATKWNCFYKSVSHYAFSAQTKKPLYSIQVYESFGNQLAACSLVSYTFRLSVDSSPALNVEISFPSFKEALPHAIMLRLKRLLECKW